MRIVWPGRIQMKAHRLLKKSSRPFLLFCLQWLLFFVLTLRSLWYKHSFFFPFFLAIYMYCITRVYVRFKYHFIYVFICFSFSMIAADRERKKLQKTKQIICENICLVLWYFFHRRTFSFILSICVCVWMGIDFC